MIAVTELTSLEQLAEYRLLWRMLHGQTRGGSFFQTREWLTTTSRWSGADWKWRTLVVSVAGKTIGIVPLVIRPLSTRLGSLRALTFPAGGPAIFQGSLGPNPTATMTAALQHLARSPRDWDLLDLHGIDDAGTDRGRTENAFRLARLPVWKRTEPAGLSVSLSEIDAGQRFLYRRQLKSLERDYWRRQRWEQIVAAPSGLAAADVFQPLWEMVSSLLSDHTPIERGLIYEAALTAAHRDALCVQILLANQSPVACLLTVAGNDRVEVLMAADRCPVAREILVGHLLFDEVLAGTPQVLFHSRFAELARPWGGREQARVRFTHFPAFSPRAQLLRLGYWLQRDRAPGREFAQRDTDWLPALAENRGPAVPGHEETISPACESQVS